MCGFCDEASNRTINPSSYTYGSPFIVSADRESAPIGQLILQIIVLIMPYTQPISPLPSPVRETATFTRKGYHTPLHVEDVGMSYSTGPMPGIPRRPSSHQSASGSSTPRRGLSPAVSRTTSATHSVHIPNGFPSQGLEPLPRRASAGSPGGIESSLGLKLHPSPTKTPQRGNKDSMDSTSTIESSLPPTPGDDPTPLPAPSSNLKEGVSIPFPTFTPPPPRALPSRALSGGQRPGILGSRRGSGSPNHKHHSGSLQINFPASASTPSIQTVIPSSDVLSPRPVRPTSSMIRKKSGEVVKPSLKQRSLSTPDLGRNDDDSDSQNGDTGGSRPFGEERSKSVRFADADADDSRALESVVLFLREQKVTAVGKAADPDRAGNMTETETDGDTDASDFVEFRTRRNAAARAIDEASNIVLEGGSRVPRIRVDFAPDARGVLKDEHVVLERVELLSSTGALQLRGTALARNVSFQKWVAVRFTMDHWQTVSEVSGAHVCHIPSATTGDEGWDRFSFSIKLDDFKRKLDERQLVMCVRFSVDGREWWDSNNGLNYNLSFKKAVPKRPNRLSTPASMGGGFKRFDESDSTDGITGLRGQRNASPTAGFGGRMSDNFKSGAKSWVFPKLLHRLSDGPPSRSDSPLPTPPPAASFKAPPMPDIHTHLSLSKYCAPSPPTSPPKEEPAPIGRNTPWEMHTLASMSNRTVSDAGQPMNHMRGNFGTTVSTAPTPLTSNDRPTSWDGTQTGSWDSFSQAMSMDRQSSTSSSANSTRRASNDGDSTPVALASRSPIVSDEGSGSESSLGPMFKASRTSHSDLRGLLNGLNGDTTPPVTLSDPPTPDERSMIPPGPSSPDQASLSTGESSPINTISQNSTPDLAGLNLAIEEEQRGRSSHPNTYKTLTNSYQEFVSRLP